MHYCWLRIGCLFVTLFITQLTAKVDLSEVQGLNAVLGDYVTRCVHATTVHYTTV
jgi:hypothetical protein